MTSSTDSTARTHKRRGAYERRKRLRADPVRFVDDHGRDCLRVPLDRQGRQHAVVTEQDYQAVHATGATGTWFLNRAKGGAEYVRTSHAGTLLTPARIITNAGARNVVRYVNGDPLDLRPENILLHRGAAKRADAVIVANSAASAEDGSW